MISAAEAFGPLRLALESAAIRYAVGGSWASTAFAEPRFTNNVDHLVDINLSALNRFLEALPADFYFEVEDARRAIGAGRPFNVIHMPSAFKFDLFPASAFALGSTELDRAVLLSDTGLSESPIPFVTAEDILLAKLHWYRLGGEVSELQWRDIKGIVRRRRDILDGIYLEQSASKLGLTTLLQRALSED